MTLGQRQRLFTFNLAKFILEAYRQGFELSMGEASRPQELQTIYVNTGRSKTMNSRHLQRLAVDFNFFKSEVLLFAAGQTTEQYVADLETVRPLGEYWESLNTDNVWGGDWNRNGIFDETFRDPYHIEMKPGV